MSDIKTKIVAELDLSQAQKQMNEFLKAAHKTKLTLDTSAVAKARAELNSLSNVIIKPKIDTGGINSAAASISSEIQQIQNLTNQISKTKLQISGLDSGGLARIQNQLHQVESDYKSLENTLNQGINFNLNLDQALGTGSIDQANKSSKSLLNTISNVIASASGIAEISDLTKNRGLLNLD